MAAFGMSVLTNRYANKDLAESVDNVFTIEEMTPEAICAGLTKLIDGFEARDMCANGLLAEGASLLRVGGLAGTADRVATAWGLR